MDDLLSTLQLKILVASRGHFSTQWRVRNDFSPYARFYLIASGSAWMRHHDRDFSLSPGNLYLIPPRSGMEGGCGRHVEIYWTHFTASVYSGLDWFDWIDCDYVWKPNNFNEIKKRFSALVTGYHLTIPAAKIRSQSIQLELLAPFYRHPLSKSNDKNRQNWMQRFKPVMEYVENHLGDKLTVSQLAKKAYLERAYFSTRFSETFGIPVKKYIIQRRIDHARRMLLDTNVKLEAIAGELGFTDAFHFSRTFKKLTGESPSDFRRRGPALP